MQERKLIAGNVNGKRRVRKKKKDMTKVKNRETKDNEKDDQEGRN